MRQKHKAQRRNEGESHSEAKWSRFTRERGSDTICDHIASRALLRWCPGTEVKHVPFGKRATGELGVKHSY